MSVTWITDAGPLDRRVNALSFTVDDMTGLVVAAFYPSGTDELIYESGAFRPKFSQSTIVAPSPPAATFTLIRTGGWPDDTTVKVYTTGGGAVYTSTVINDTGIAGSGTTDKDCLIFINNRITNLTQDQIGPAFAITSFTVSGSRLVRRGTAFSSVTATAAYASPATTASVANATSGSTNGSDVAPGSWSGSSPWTSWSMSGSIQLFGASGGADPVWTVTDTAVAATTKNSVVTTTFTDDIWYGVSSNANINTSAGILALPSNVLTTTRGLSGFTLTPSNQYIYYCVPDARGAVTFTANGFPLAMTLLGTVSVTNSQSAVNLYKVYRSTNLLTGTYACVSS